MPQRVVKEQLLIDFLADHPRINIDLKLKHDINIIISKPVAW